MNLLEPKLLSLCIATTLLMASPFAVAQTAADASDAQATKAAQDPATSDNPTALEQITVSARGVAEPLQSMPIPISAVTEKAIANKGMQDIRDIADSTPGFSFRSGYGRGFDRPVIRGMANIQGEPNASFFIDGIYVEGDISGYGLENLERVEVIRGPQSAAFGRRTFSGAVNFITKRPGSDPGGKLTVGGGSYGQYRYSASYSNSLADGKFGYDLSFVHRGNDGIFYNPVSDKKDIGGTETTGMMAAARWRPVTGLEVTGRIGLQRTNDQFFPIARLGSDKLNCYMPVLTGGTMGGIPIASTRRKGYICGTVEAPKHYPANTPEYAAAGFPAGNRGKHLRSSLVVDYTFSNLWSITSTSAYNESELRDGTDQDYSGIRGFAGQYETFGKTKSRDFSQDLRLTTDLEAPVYATLGTYYLQESAGRGYTGSLAGFMVTPGVPGAKPVAVATDPQGQTVNKAVYAFVNWRINDKWTTSLEGRYASDEISMGGVDSRSIIIGGVRTLVSRNYSLSETFKNFTPRVTLGYQWNDHFNVYALASRGTKPGGFNDTVQRADLSDPVRNGLEADGLHRFEEETAWNYELGFKSDLLDNSLRLNANVFQINWTNQQLTESRAVMLINNTILSSPYTTNIGKSRIRGLEVASQWNFAPGWQGTLAYSYTDTRILNFINQNYADIFSEKPYVLLSDPEANAKGRRLPRVPKNMLSLGLMYEGRLANGWGWMANGDMSYESNRYTQVDNLLGTGPATKVNFRLSIDPSKNWRISAYVNNAFNNKTPEDITRYIDPTTYVALPALPPATGVQATNMMDFAVSATRPRMFGLEASYKF